MLDLYCCAGGAAKGYDDAGFDVVGVDVNPQPHYPYEFIQADALEVLADKAFMALFDAAHGSPPCHDHTPLSALSGLDGTGRLLAATREGFQAASIPWVIENVPGAPMRADLTLCGGMFGLRTYRHRWFELSGSLGLVSVPYHPPHRALTATKRRRERWAEGWHVSITGDVGVYVGPEAMGIGWMNGAELSQAIPPPYTEYVGRLLTGHLREAAA
jgi:DNA (cytosine-5)-methyltransferase 1